MRNVSQLAHIPNKTKPLTGVIGNGIKSTRKSNIPHRCGNCGCGRYSECGCMKKKPKSE